MVSEKTYDLLRIEIRRYRALARRAELEWQKNQYSEMAEALTVAAAALRGRGATKWSISATRSDLSRED